MFKLLYIFLLFTCVSSEYSGGLRKGPIEAECLSFLQRERIWVPVALENVSDPTTGPPTNPIRLARYHIIPVRTLRQFFDTAITSDNENNDESTGLMSLMGTMRTNALEQYKGLGDLNSLITDELVYMRDLRTLYIDHKHDLNMPSMEILASPHYLVRSMYQWMPANIFIGPESKLRSDDHGDSFEFNSRYIINETAYSRLVTINRMMNSYVKTHEKATYNEVIELLREISHGLPTPYPFNEAQWIFDSLTKRYRINTNPNNRKNLQATEVTFIDSDPYCLRPLVAIKISIYFENLNILAEAIRRVIKHKGFFNQDYNSWKDWYVASSWEFGIYGEGLSMAGEGGASGPYGFTFKDGSFSVGILGTDTNRHGNIWNYLGLGFQYLTDKEQYAGQAFFDKDGRPVAIVITSLAWSQSGFGWSFIYNNGEWEYERTDSWDERRFAGSTVSLDSTALKFVKA